MRKCGNCYNGHYNLSERGEELFCDESEFMEEDTEENSVCESHRYYPGFEEEQNFIFYDDSYIGPGYLIVQTENNKMKKFIKIYNTSEAGFPFFAIRAYSKDTKEDPDEEFSTIDFSVRDIEDDENGLYEIFTKLSHELSGKKIFSMDKPSQADNHFELTSNGKVTTMRVSKDTMHGTQHSSDFIDIIIGDDYLCEAYPALLHFYQGLARKCNATLSTEDVKKLLLEK